MRPARWTTRSLYRLQAGRTGVSAYSLAFLDCLGGPKLVSVDSSHWTGRIGESIHFHVRDNIRVMQVCVMVHGNQWSKTALESGYAFPSRLNPAIWTYVTQTAIRQTPGLYMDVLARDLAGISGQIAWYSITSRSRQRRDRFHDELADL